jgi:hypothetical protein
VYKPSFYGFALAALVPLIARVAFEGTRSTCSPRWCFSSCRVRARFRRRINDVLTQSLAIRHENVDLIGEPPRRRTPPNRARGGRDGEPREEPVFAAASHDLRQPLHAMGLFAAALPPRRAIPT